MDCIAIHTRIKNLCISKGITVSQLVAETGLKKSAVDSIKTGAVPSAEKIQIIANYFGVSTDYILGNEVNGQKNLDPETLNIAEFAADLSEENKKKLLEYAELLKNSQKK